MSAAVWRLVRIRISGPTGPKHSFLVKPDTVVAWRRAGYRLFWTWDPAGREWGGRSRNEKRESDLGRPAHPWRVGSTRLRDLRTYRVMQSATPEARSGLSMRVDANPSVAWPPANDGA